MGAVHVGSREDRDKLHDYLVKRVGAGAGGNAVSSAGAPPNCVVSHRSLSSSKIAQIARGIGITAEAVDSTLAPVPVNDIKLKVQADGASVIDYGDSGLRSAVKKWGKAKNSGGKAKDSAVTDLSDEDLKTELKAILAKPVAWQSHRRTRILRDELQRRLATGIYGKAKDSTLAPVPVKDAVARCTECGKMFKNVDELDDHQEETGHFNYPVGHPSYKAPAKDSATTTVAGLLALLWAWYHRQPETVGPSDYNLNTYRPAKRTW